MRNIASMTLVPMTKDSIFDDSFIEFEFQNVTSEVSVWINNLKAWNPGINTGVILDVFGPEINRVKYFATAPCGKFGYETFEVKSYLFEGNVVAAARYLSDLINKHGSDFILNAIHSNPHISRTSPEFSVSVGWKFRYAIKGAESVETVFGESREVAERHFQQKTIGRSVSPPGPIPS